MRRRQFIALVGGAAASWGALAQQPPLPAIGFLRNTSAYSSAHLVEAFIRGLQETGFVPGKNIAIEYRWTDGREDQLPVLAADLVGRQVSVIVAAGGSAVALAAKAATTTIPVVFELGGDPVRLGLVASLNRPGGNLTGIALFANSVGPKRMQLLHELVPTATAVGFLVYFNNPVAERDIEEGKAAASLLGQKFHVLRIGAEQDIDTAFQTFAQLKVGGVIVAPSPFFISRRDRMIAMAARFALPTIFPFRNFATSGGLMSYGDSLTDAFRHMGGYVGKILAGTKPADLPVMQPTKFELVINLKTAKALGVTVPPSMLALADEVIE